MGTTLLGKKKKKGLLLTSPALVLPPQTTMDFSDVRADMLPELFEQAKATPRKTLAFQSSDRIKFEAELTACGEKVFILEIYVRAGQFDDNVTCEMEESGEDWIRQALEGSGLRFIEENATTYGRDHWGFSRVNSEAFFGKGWGDESRFWTAALDELKRAQATHACECGNALTTADKCPACWVAAAKLAHDLPAADEADEEPRKKKSRSRNA